MFDYLIILASLIVFDVFWLALFMTSFYKEQLGHTMPEKVHLASAIPFYLVLSFAILIFVVSPGEVYAYTYVSIFMRGVLLGITAYAAYDFTNQAVVKGWTWKLTCIDLAWGGFMTGFVSFVAVLL